MDTFEKENSRYLTGEIWYREDQPPVHDSESETLQQIQTWVLRPLTQSNIELTRSESVITFSSGWYIYIRREQDKSEFVAYSMGKTNNITWGTVSLEEGVVYENVCSVQKGHSKTITNLSTRLKERGFDLASSANKDRVIIRVLEQLITISLEDKTSLDFSSLMFQTPDPSMDSIITYEELMDDYNGIEIYKTKKAEIIKEMANDYIKYFGFKSNLHTNTGVFDPKLIALVTDFLEHTPELHTKTDNHCKTLAQCYRSHSEVCNIFFNLKHFEGKEEMAQFYISHMLDSGVTLDIAHKSFENVVTDLLNEKHIDNIINNKEEVKKRLGLNVKKEQKKEKAKLMSDIL